MFTNGEKVVKETHDVNKRNVIHDFIDSNVASKTHHIPKIDMRKFDGKDPTTGYENDDNRRATKKETFGYFC